MGINHRKRNILLGSAVAIGLTVGAIVTVIVTQTRSSSDSNSSANLVSNTLQPTLSPTRFASNPVGTSAPVEIPTTVSPTIPMQRPSLRPTASPTKQPSAAPIKLQTSVPTKVPVQTITAAPTKKVTTSPTLVPTEAPIQVIQTITTSPTKLPTTTNSPTTQPTNSPVALPVVSTSTPSLAPTKAPILDPTEQPTPNPSPEPSLSPTRQPTPGPTLEPSPAPTKQPTPSPTNEPDPVQSRKLKVFILTGQSNMVGTGVVGTTGQKGTVNYITKTEKKYRHLLDSQGQWTKRDDVSFVYKNNKSQVKSPLTVGLGLGPKFIGPELQIGHALGDALDEPVLLLKVGVGNRALGWDLLPPGTSAYTFTDLTFPGYGQCPSSWKEGEGPASSCSEFYAGYQYDHDRSNVKQVLDNLADYVPGYSNQGFEVAGFFFWQGHRDTGRYGHAENYGKHLDQYIKSMRNDYSAYGGQDAPYVVGTIGFFGCDETKWDFKATTIFDAQMSVSGGNVKTVDTRPFWRLARDSPQYEPEHYHRNANVYLETGTSMGAAMVDLLTGSSNYDGRTC